MTDGVEAVGEFGVAISDHECEAHRMLVEVHQQVPRPLTQAALGFV
jgi:hypothetical protein